MIGKDGHIPWHISDDLKRFKRLTMGHTIITGRKNHESIGRLLPGRRTIILSRQPHYRVDGAAVCPSLDAALQATDPADDEPFIIGGACVYADALPHADRIYLTQLHQDFDGNVRFPPYDAQRFVVTHREDYNQPIPHSFMILNRKPT